VRDGLIPHNWWPYGEAGHTDEAKKELDRLFGGNAPFDTPKPVRLLTRICQVGGVGPDDIVLDFFAGSGSTAHAVLDLNRQDGGRRKFILIQLPEPTGKEGYTSIASITRERVKRVIEKQSDDDTPSQRSDTIKKQIEGFRYFKLTESNFTTWDVHPDADPKTLKLQLQLHIDHIREGRDSEQILYELLLKSGFPLSTLIENEIINEKIINTIASGALIICLEQELTLEIIKAIADRKPERVVCLDRGFSKNDQLKANAVQIFKSKGIEIFRTV
jgi:adenine-specific DNA-methyltransferase